MPFNWREDDVSLKDASPCLGARNDIAVAYQCHGSNVGPMGTVRSGNRHATGGVPFIVNAAESCARESHARQSDIARCLDGSGGFATNQGGTIVAYDLRNGLETGDVAQTLQVGDHGAAPNNLPHVMAWDPRNVTSADNRSRVEPGMPCPTLHEQAMAIAFQERGRAGGRSLEHQADVAYALTAPNGGGRRHEMNIAARAAVRRLTPRECERLQGFPDDYTLIPYRGKPASDGPRYKALGNSMAVPVMRWIGRRILEATP